jgi:hypothetical protein
VPANAVCACRPGSEEHVSTTAVLAVFGLALAMALVSRKGRWTVSSALLTGRRAPPMFGFDQFGNSSQDHTTSDRSTMIILGIILLLIGYFTGLSILYTIGGILVVVGIVLWILGAVGRPVGGRKVWF